MSQQEIHNNRNSAKCKTDREKEVINSFGKMRFGFKGYNIKRNLMMNKNSHGGQMWKHE